MVLLCAECPAIPENAQEDVADDATTILLLVNYLHTSFASEHISGDTSTKWKCTLLSTRRVRA